MTTLDEIVGAYFRQNAKKGGIARAKKLTPKRRKEIATIASRAAQKKRRSKNRRMK